MKKLIAIVAATVMALGLLAVAPASAQDDYAPDTSLVCDDATPTAGDTVECEITACDPNTQVIATINGDQVGSTVTDVAGNGLISITIPDGIEGNATVLVDGCGDIIAAVLAVQVAPDLAFTGSDSLPTALIAVALIAFGAVLALGARRYQLAAVRRGD